MPPRDLAGQLFVVLLLIGVVAIDEGEDVVGKAYVEVLAVLWLLARRRDIIIIAEARENDNRSQVWSGGGHRDQCIARPETLANGSVSRQDRSGGGPSTCPF